MASNLDRFKSGANSFGTRYVDGLFKPSISYRARANYDKETIQTLAQNAYSKPKPYVDTNKERSFLDRGFDALLMPNYIVAGMVDGAVRDDKTILGGAWGGIKAGNPFGKGFEEGETTFSNVLESSGWEDDAFWGSNFTRGTAGFALDVLLDPTTYMTFGISALIKGTGKTGRAAQTIEKLAAENPQFADGLREAGEMTDELAESIVMKANGIKSFDEIADTADDVINRVEGKKIGREQFIQEVQELKKTYNNIVGVGRTGQGISIGVKNMPFGDFVARKLGITSAPKTLIKDESIRKVSNAIGFSDAYQASRNAFYGSKFGQALSRNSGLRKLAEADPAKLYEYVGALNKLRGKNLDKLAKETYIKDFSAKLMDLSPAEQKKIIKALENPSLWKALDEIKKGAGTATWAKMEDEYKTANEALKSEISKAKEILDEYKDGSDLELKDFKKQLGELSRLENLSTEQRSSLSTLNDELDKLIKAKEDVNARFTVEPKDYSKVLNDLDDEIENLSSARMERIEQAQLEELPYKLLSSDEINGRVTSMLDNIHKLTSDLDSIKTLDELPKAKTAAELARNAAIKDAGSKSTTNLALNLQSEVSSLRKAISEILYGNPDALPVSTTSGRIISLAEAMKAGDNYSAFRSAIEGEMGGHNFAGTFQRSALIKDIWDNSDNAFEAIKAVLKNDDLMSDDAIAVYKYLAKKYGYGAIAPIRKRTGDIANQLGLKSDGSLSRPLKDDIEVSMYAEYKANMQMFSKRSADLRTIQAVGDAKAQAKYIKQIEKEQLADEMYETLFGDIDMAKRTSDVINDLSDTRDVPGYAGTKYNAKLNTEDMSFADEASTWGKNATPEQIELDNMKAATADKPYTYEQVNEASREPIKSFLLKNRRDALLNYRLTDTSKKALGSMRKYADEMEKAKADFVKHRDRINRAREKAKPEDIATLDKDFQKLKEHTRNNYQRSLRNYKKARDYAEQNTNLFDVMKQIDTLKPDEIKRMATQLEASVYLQHKLYPNHQFFQVTSKQKARLSGISYKVTTEYIKKNGVPKKADLEKFYKHIDEYASNDYHKKLKDVLVEQRNTAHKSLIREKVDYYQGIEFKAGSGVERGVVVGIKEDTVKKTRQELDVKRETPNYEEVFETIEVPRMKDGKPVISKKTGKPVMKKVVRSVPPKTVETRTMRDVEYEEGLGTYTYQVETPSGVISVKSTDVVGTYTNQINETATRIPKFIEEEIERIDDVINQLKARVRGTKGAQTKQDKKIAKLDRLKQIKLEALDKQAAKLQSKIAEDEFFLNEYSKLIDEKQDLISRLFGTNDPSVIVARNEAEVAQLEKNLDDMVARQEHIEKALKDTELFEDLVRLDLGESAYLKALEESAEGAKSADKLVIDVLNNYDEHTVALAKAIRNDFKNAGLDEVAVGKLDEGAFKTMVDKYFPRKLSEDGKKFFDDNPELADKYLSPTNSYGFGKVFNESVLSRNEELRNKTLEEVNDYFQNKVGVRIFEENLGKAYLTRMMDSSEMVYDQRAMHDLMYRFGHSAPNKESLIDGYSPVANYGELRQVLREKVLKIVKQEMNETKVKFTKEEFDAKTRQYAEEMLDLAGLDARILDGYTTPLIRVEPDNLEKFRAVFGDKVRQVNNMTVDRANQVRELTQQRDENKLLQIYDKFLTFFKLNQTTIMPSFQIRNHIGAMFVGWLGVGSDALSIRSQRQMYRALKAYGNPDAMRELGNITTVSGKTYRMSDIMDLAQTYSVVDEGFMLKDFSSKSYSQGTRIIPGKFDPFNTAEFGLYKIGSKVATYSDNINRMVQFSALIKQGKTPAEAADTVRKYMFDYSDLTTFEMTWMKRIFPYYTYMRKNIPLMANEFLDNPEKLQLVAKLENLPESMVSDEDRIAEGERTGYAQDWLQMPFNLSSTDMMGNPTEQPVLFNTNLPYMQLRDIDMQGDLGEQARTLFAQTAPMLKVPVELATNWNSFFDAPIVNEYDVEQGNEISPKVAHVMSQLAAYNAVSQFVSAKTGDDKVLSLLANGAGMRFSTYDVEMAREKIYEESYNQEFELTVKNIFGSGVTVAKGLVDNAKANMSDYAVKLAGKPYNAEDEVGVYAPISDRTYDEMSEDERKLYTFDSDTKAYVHSRALEFEKQQYEETGIFKKFLWTIVESTEPETTVVRVDKVIDGDTFTADFNGKQQNVRLLLVDTPESKGEYEGRPQRYSEEAAQYTTDMILGKDVKLYLDDELTYGRRLAFVEVGGKNLQEELVREGLGKVRQYDTNYTDTANELYNVEEEAYNSGRGVWDQKGPVPRSNTGFVR